ncbi:A/G-specific DNA glycosylase [Bifidobacterium tsurumiense]|uniref:Adenine DNA glycosylase n=1 Tax=Bifidobacterium tsurumiense TaxID=356829 RepID=A0A087EK49_9BIFI|nr:A/G-specific DNA glycosylase [Bifidobacterium tsurumiense]
MAVHEEEYREFAQEFAPRANEVRRRLAAWWQTDARDLPWRFGRATPWGVLVSEVMSQQTQMSRVVPYWQTWITTWPDAASLSKASAAEVITAWGRLGYPRRALRLQECARVVSEQYHNQLPHSYEELLALPGIGDYTASAVMSFAYGQRIAVIDTNIRRVLSRVFLGKESLGGSTTPVERALANAVLPDDGRNIGQIPESVDADVKPAEQMPHAITAGNAADSKVGDPAQKKSVGVSAMHTAASVIWNQSVMELGAVVCTAKQPLCETCPIAEQCVFLSNGRPGLGQRRTRPRQRFAGTDRQVRGIVLHALRQAQTQTITREQVEALWKDSVQLDKCVASLDDDGLIEIMPDGSVRLPQ